ncbi:hypothetical protein W97_02881 [Coniosporium apollinis CBS 100218]|uniref:protein O-GlcNAc transferase n=1 Tax=Coniosporium apollinis (strain CBS 100218) TaxID=1168221 RepID=R7YP85_CONA1|nr:uncharacterized protein W97_02881 [Coniosporium apollinis CBS 100218]EON63653.1 hypothetical protein W97_02881 [Coniosporium apollinis CBS 100218]
MTTIRPYPPQLQSQPQPFDYISSGGPYNSLPASPRSSQRGGLATHEYLAPEQQLPQHYAHPLQRNNSYPAQGTNDGQISSKQTENMLRRKTPNGILTAAYDGTSVEQTDKPHAMKHILLPITSAGALNVAPSFHGVRQELPLRTPSFSRDMYTFGNQQSAISAWNSGVQPGLDAAGSKWTNPQQFLPQIDSMLNQVPTQPPLVPYAQYGSYFCGNMQYPMQSQFAPTVSNEQGPYGPYWPNGTFVPYRPAALRDPRFQHMATNWTANQLNPYFSRATENWQQPADLAVNPNAVRRAHTHYQARKPLPPAMGYNAIPSHQDYPASLSVQSIDQHRHLDQQYTPTDRRLASQVASQSYVQGLPRPIGDHYSSVHSSGQTTPRGFETPPAVTSLAEFGPQSSNAQLRERVFDWAHSIYVELLTYLHQTRRAALNTRHPGNQQSSNRPNIYPKPPRQPNSSFTFPPTARTRSTNDAQLSHSAMQQDDISPSQVTNQAVALQRPGQLHNRSHSLWSSGNNEHTRPEAQRRLSWQQGLSGVTPLQPSAQPPRTLRRTSGLSVSATYPPINQEISVTAKAASALETLTNMVQDSAWNWVDGMLVGGCLAYALGEYQKALAWYSKILDIDPDHAEAISNLAATLLALNRRSEAERYWLRAIKLRPSYFEAVEHLIGLLCSDQRGKDAVNIIDFVERSLRYTPKRDSVRSADGQSERSASDGRSPSLSDASDKAFFDFDSDMDGYLGETRQLPGSTQEGFGSSGYAIPGSENGRILALVHAKGNMLYALGDNVGAAKAFESAVLIGAGRHIQGIGGLINHILTVVGQDTSERLVTGQKFQGSSDPILLPPDKALLTARLCFPNHGELPGLRYVSAEGMALKAAVSTTSNSLLSLAKIFQDGMVSNSPKSASYQTTYGVREILALYYLSLSLQPSPSTANNVGILLASVQSSQQPKQNTLPARDSPIIPGIAPGSGIALALAYYNYGLLLDSRHAHLFTNLGSLLKDIGQLSAAIKMYEQAVACDGNFDIALANLANAVKDQGRISDAITYYKRAVKASPDFAEAVCGLANALNSVCAWAGRGGVAADGGKRDRWHVDENGMLLDAKLPGASSSGWIKRVVDLVEKQLADGEEWGRGSLDNTFLRGIIRHLSVDVSDSHSITEKEESMRRTLASWSNQKWEGARLVRLAERAIRRLGWQWYQDRYVVRVQRPSAVYARPRLPSALPVPAAPTVLPFHTFTCPMSAKQIRLISQRNALRISTSALKAPWLPPTVYPPPPPPNPYLKVGYVSSDFNNHPLAHLMQSVFGLHDTKKVKAYCYATTASDNSVHRQQIEREAPVFYDASSWPAEKLVGQIVRDGIHILVNLNGYTRGARNEVFAARPAPIHMSFMGFAGTLGAEWCDYLLADETAIPLDTLRPWRRNVDLEDQLVDDNSGGEQEDWIYGENIIFCRDTFFCCDHRQSAPDAEDERLDWEGEMKRRYEMRKELFPQLKEGTIILGNFNQLYKIDPTTFRTWLRILSRLPNAILWLLRFPDLGESELLSTARAWAGRDVASRILFTDVAPKHQHISRAAICDLFLDTPECNAHTTAADVLWSGTPLLTRPRYSYKMCSRMAASILKGALPRGVEGERAARELVAESEEEYEECAVRLAGGCWYEGYRVRGRLSELRKMLWEGRWSSALFDTRRWVRDLEEAYGIAWERWVRGEGGDIWLEGSGSG